MNILTDSLCDFVITGGKKYGVNSDFKTMIKIQEAVSDESLNPARKLAKALSLFYKTLPGNLKDAIAGMKMFYETGEKKEYGKGERLYSFSSDAELIYSAFYSQYNIDLNSENMHYRKFIALFKGLCGENAFSKAVSFRAVDIGEIKNEKLKRYYQKMKRKYSLGSMTLEEGLKAVF